MPSPPPNPGRIAIARLKQTMKKIQNKANQASQDIHCQWEEIQPIMVQAKSLLDGLQELLDHGREHEFGNLSAVKLRVAFHIPIQVTMQCKHAGTHTDLGTV